MKNLGNKNKSNNFDSLSERIANFEAIMTAEKKKQNRTQIPVAGIALAGRVTTELVAGVVVGTFIGWAFDNWLGTAPTLMVVFFFLGSAAGMMNVWRALTGRGRAAGFVNEKSLQADENKADEQNSGRD